MTGLVVLFVVGVLVVGGSGSRVGMWTGGLTAVAAAVGIVVMTVVSAVAL